MKVIMVDPPDGDVIAREVDEPCGEFFLRDDGEIHYRHPWDSKVWFVNSSQETFVASCRLVEQYCEEVRKCQSEEAELKVVHWLAEQLKQIEEYDEGTFWSVIVEQAEHGMF